MRRVDLGVAVPASGTESEPFTQGPEQLRGAGRRLQPRHISIGELQKSIVRQVQRGERRNPFGSFRGKRPVSPRVSPLLIFLQEVRKLGIDPNFFNLARFQFNGIDVKWLQELKKGSEIFCQERGFVREFMIPKKHCTILIFVHKNEVAKRRPSDGICSLGKILNVSTLLRDFGDCDKPARAAELPHSSKRSLGGPPASDLSSARDHPESDLARDFQSLGPLILFPAAK